MIYDIIYRKPQIIPQLYPIQVQDRENQVDIR